jgi:zinc resistance-associated protein
MLVLALVLSLGLASASYARMGMGGCGPHGMGMMNLTPEQAGQMFDLKQKFMNDTAALRKQMVMKRAEMAALWRVETPDQAQIRAKQKELGALRDQMQEKAMAFRLECKKICPTGGKMGGMGMGGGCGMACGMGMGGGPDGPGL